MGGVVNYYFVYFCVSSKWGNKMEFLFTDLKTTLVDLTLIITTTMTLYHFVAPIFNEEKEND